MFNYIIKSESGYSDYNYAKIVAHVVLGFVGIILLFNIFGTVNAGERGVRTQFGAVTGEVLSEGLYVKIPFVQKVVRMDVKTQKDETQASAASKDLQTVNSQVAFQYSINHEAVARLFQEVGIDYKVRLIDPAIQESVKASTARFTAEELITKREEVKEEIRAALAERLASNGIVVENFSIINFDFSPSFNAAIEAKVTAEQNALAAKNKLAQVEYEAQQAIESAKGRAEALRVESVAISSNPRVLELRAIEKWDGQLPQVTGANVPFINIK